jgi:hypothetical protein
LEGGISTRSLEDVEGMGVAEAEIASERRRLRGVVGDIEKDSIELMASQAIFRSWYSFE